MLSPKNGDVTSGTLRVKVIPGMKQKLFSITQTMLGGWTMQDGQTKQGELLIALTHEDHMLKPKSDKDRQTDCRTEI